MENFSQKQQANLKPLATKKQAANFFQISERSIDNLREKGVLKGIKIGNQIRFNWSELDALSQKGTGVQNG